MNLLNALLILVGGTCWALFLHYIAQQILKNTPKSPVVLTKSSTQILACVSVLVLLFLTITKINPHYQPVLFIFWSALVIASITDLQSLLISRFTSLFLVPIGWVCAGFNVLPITLLASITGSIFGYILLSATAFIFYLVTKRHGLGQGDSDLLAFIGAFTGPVGVWISVLFGSLLGSVAGIILMVFYRAKRSTPMPFGPFLALGALIYIFFQVPIFAYIMPGHLAL